MKYFEINTKKEESLLSLAYITYADENKET